MNAFNFPPLPTDLHFGRGILRMLPERLKALGAGRVFLVTDPGVRAAGLLERAACRLAESGVEFVVFDSVKPDSGAALIDAAAAELKGAACNVVTGLGGGSSLDTAKAVAALATNAGSALDYVGLGKLHNPPLPVVAIPTTAGTGSEVTLWSVFTDEARELKVAIGSPLLYPAVALCDPELTLGLPAALTASTGMDALAHAIECYTNKACQPISAALAIQAIELVGRQLRTAVRDGGNIEAREGMMLASTMAGMAMNPTRLGLAHALAMPLGSWDLRVPHGVILGVLLPVVMEFNHAAAPERFAEVARALGEPVNGDAPARAVAAVRALARDIGIPASLASYGVRPEHVSQVVAEAVKSGNVPVNPRPAGTDELAGILREVL